MRTKANQDIRNEAKKAGVRMWEIAEKYGTVDAVFSRKLRHELSEDEKTKIFSIINELREAG